MKFSAWLDYPSMSIAIQKVESGYKCVKFIEGSVLRDATRTVASLKELEFFLKELPGSSSVDIKTIIQKLGMSSE